MKDYSGRAITSLVLGFVGLLFLQKGVASSLVLAFLLGVLAVGLGVRAVWAIQKAPHRGRGTAWAVLGIFLGEMVVILSLSFLPGASPQQRHSPPMRRPVRYQTQSPVRFQARQVPQSFSPMPEEPATHFTSNVPLIVLETDSSWISKGRSTMVRARLFVVHDGQASLEATPDYAGKGTIHVRGYSTLQLPKHSYTFHTVDDRTNEVKVSLLGLPAESDWVLYAPFEDKTLMRDVLAYELASQMGGYAPRSRYVELFLNTSRRPVSLRDYAGVYVLIEKIKRGKNRVNIAKLGPDDTSDPEITGGYIVKRDHRERRDASFETLYGGPYFYVYPKADVITAEQKSWLERYFKAFESALNGANFRDPRRGYAAYLDVDSFIDAHWLVEVSKNVDGFRYSAFLTKDRGGKLRVGPPWDWNRSFGNANYYGGWQIDGWYWNNLRSEEISWYQRLREDPGFVERCTRRWLELRKSIFDPKRICARIDELATQLDAAQRRNFQRWPILGEQITCNYYVGDSFQDEVRWLKDWIVHRVRWIDSQLNRPTNL